jgi:asparagine synthase (glutamine-hydrolysing)
MCGICGIVSNDASERIDPRVVIRMRDTLSHRGPDDQGDYIGPGVALGHRRLSIIDLRLEGRQPMANEDDSIHIVFNGEIYNFADQREWLASKGHRFRSRSDTEVIVHLYEELGVECVKRLRGMFAFAIWDEPKRLLFLARDRLGKKPLFYHFDGRRLLFGSEPKSILAYPGVAREADPEALDYYISFGYVPGPFSAFKGVRKLEPAHYLTFQRGRLDIRRYWQVHYLPKLHISEREAGAQIVERLTEAVKIRLVSDVPLGAFLSGGIDSSAVVAVMAKLTNTPVKTFSIGFKEPRYDETRYAQIVARKFGTDHHEFVVEPDATAVLDKLVWHYDEPYSDASALPTYYLSKLTRDHVTVALNGDGGDENFGGYPRYLVNVIAEYLYAIPGPLRRLANGAAFQSAKLFQHNPSFAKKLRILANTLMTEPRAGYSRKMINLNAEGKRRLYSDEFARSVSLNAAEKLIANLYLRSDAQDLIDATLNVDLDLYLPDDLLVKVDIASMAVGLEARSPMVDHEFIEFVARLPSRFKISGLTLKAIFKKALRDILPAEILGRRKMGFGVPLEHWFRGQLRDFLRDTLLSRQALERGYFKPSAVRALIDAHLSGSIDHQYQLWNLLMLELWHRVCVDTPMTSGADRTVSVTAF